MCRQICQTDFRQLLLVLVLVVVMMLVLELVVVVVLVLVLLLAQVLCDAPNKKLRWQKEPIAFSHSRPNESVTRLLSIKLMLATRPDRLIGKCLEFFDLAHCVALN